MRTSSRFRGWLAAVCLLFVTPLVGRGEIITPVPVVPPAEAAPSPWHVDAEFAVLFNVAMQRDGYLYSPVALTSSVAQTGLSTSMPMIWPGPSAKDNNPVFVSPRVFVSYDFGECGSARLTYRNLTKAGTMNNAEGWPYADWSSRRTFTVNWVDLDYVSAEFAPADGWRLRCEAGGRFVHSYNGYRDESPYWRGDTTFTYFGGGPHLGLTSNCRLGDSGWDLFARADAGVTFGGRDAEYRSEAKSLPYQDVALTIGPYTYRTSTSAYQFDFNLQLGTMRRCQLAGYDVGLGFGVQAEVLSFGTLDNGGGSPGTFGFVNVGPFLRSEVLF